MFEIVSIPFLTECHLNMQIFFNNDISSFLNVLHRILKYVEDFIAENDKIRRIESHVR
jgi:hypothetical protein